MSILRFFESRDILRRKILVIFVLLIAALSVVEIWVVNRLSTYGEQISQLQITKSSIILENQVLENQIAQKESFLEVEKKAQEAGFQKIKNVEYLSN